MELLKKAGIFAVLFAVVLFWGTRDGGVCAGDYRDINAIVAFTGTQFEITNNTPYGWRNVELTVNKKYILRINLMKAKETYTVGAMQFTKKDGSRFNPFTHAPLTFQIVCDFAGGRGFYACRWK